MVHRSVETRRALTLIELVVVLVVLAALAALLVPRLGFVKDSADTVQAASGAGEVANNLEIYKATTGLYPLRLDSLLNKDASGLYTQFFSTSGAAAPNWLQMEDLGAGKSITAQGYSLIRSGITTVMDHADYTVLSDPSASGTIERDLNTSGKVATVVTSSSTGARIMQYAGFDAATLGNTKLVALGVGPRCSLVGQTMASVPRMSMSDQDHYGRFIAIFACYDSGFGLATKSAELRCVVDARGVPVDTRLNQYRLTTPQQQ
jgi:prepilin-type N-terminal cleavage/methylation domain-containing protein